MECDMEISTMHASGQRRYAGAGARARAGVGAGVGSGKVRRQGIKASRNGSEGRATGGLPYSRVQCSGPEP